jgi:hypothetical protein
MRLTEMWSYTPQGFEQNKSYNAEDDISVLDSDDTRKTRLRLRDINKMRLASEAHDLEQREQAEFVQKMYGQPAAAEDNLSL